MPFDPAELTQELIRCKSITPHEGGALDYVQARLTELGFRCHRMVFSAPNTPDVDNLFARIGSGEPHLCFAGHTDVVPPGDEKLWTHPPFAGQKGGSAIYGRGASDMKGAIACFMAAAAGWIGKNDARMKGSISFLITGDEEGPSVNGTEKVLHWMQAKGHIPTHCLVGEPTNPRCVGDMLKIGRRGYMNGTVTVRGKSGHVAYAHLARNPIPGLAKAVTAFSELELDRGNAFFEPSNLQFTTVDVGNDADNVIPDAARASFGVRFSNEYTYDSLCEKLNRVLGAALAGSELEFDLQTVRGAEAFLTEPGDAVLLLEQSIQKVTGLTPERSTSGGTSDARFIRAYCPVFEFGLVNATIHQVNEHVACADLDVLTAIYSDFIARYFADA